MFSNRLVRLIITTAPPHSIGLVRYVCPCSKKQLKEQLQKILISLAYSCRRLSQLWCTCLVWRSCDTRWSYLQRWRNKQRGTEMSRGWRNCHPGVSYEGMNKSNKKKERSKWKLEAHITSKGHTSYRAPAAPNHPKQFLQLETLHRTLEDIPSSNSGASITL